MTLQSERLKATRKATLIGIASNSLLALIKILTGYFGHSYALMADGIESAADVASSTVVLQSILVAHKPADKEHPYGHGRAETLAAGLVSLVLLATAGWIIVEAATHIIHPHSHPEPYTLIVLLSVALLKELIFRFVSSVGKKYDSLALRVDASHHRSDAISSFAAAVGITIALVGGPAYATADAWAAVVAGLIIAWNGLNFLRPVISELMEEAPPPEFVREVKRIAREIQGVKDVEKCYARRIGNGMIVELHVEVEPTMNVENAHFVSHQVKDTICERLSKVDNVVVHIEPYRPKV